MNRRDRDQYDYGRYEGYNRNDEHYHSARNLTDDFERHYQREVGHNDNDRNRIPHSYHEGDMSGSYERLRDNDPNFRGSSGNLGNDWSRSSDHSGSNRSGRDRDDFSTGRDVYTPFRDDYRGNQGRSWQDSARNQSDRGNRRQGYMLTNYDGTFGRYDDLERDNNRSDSGRGNYSNSRNNFGGSDYSARNYGGSGYIGGQRGTAYGSSSYGSTGGNYSGYGQRGDRDNSYGRTSRDDNDWLDSDRNRYY
ncbi:hypothetical protein POKO110462_12950 [Pontibacter korlensis]|uniref:Uncharacterized protein n=1 Tax=Pontibacter korlensis TaxID=400092 RepID=A0A0E3ZGK0_9BACT|nr:hypothetical protein [Pontibacter korlensis]AKD04028.1 hypothetical protein PKOR_14155 [Pontibacter korlensis]